MDNEDFRFGNFAFSRIRGLSEGKRHIRMPRRLVLLLQMLLDADGDAVDAEALQTAYAQRSRNPHAAKISLSQNIFWLRRHLKDTDGSIIQTVLKKGYRIGVPILRSGAAPGAARGETSLSGQLPVEATPAPPPVVSDLSTEVSSSVVLKPANENHGSAAFANLSPEAVITRAVTGSIRLADHAGKMTGALARLADNKAGSPPDLAMLGWLKGVASGELDDGLSLVDRALDLSPKLAAAHFYRAWLLMASRRMEPALNQLERGLSFDSRNDSLLFLKGWALCALGYRKDQEALTARALAIHPNHLMLRLVRSIGLALQGEARRAESLIAQTAMLFPQSTLLVANLAWLRAVQGDGQMALKLLTGRQKLASGYMPPISIAAVYSVLGDGTSASAYLGFANVDQDPWRHLVWCDPRFNLLDNAGGSSTLSL